MMRIASLVLFALGAATARAQQAALDSALRGLEAKGFSGVVRVEHVV